MAIEDEPPEQAALDEAEFEREEDEADASRARHRSRIEPQSRKARRAGAHRPERSPQRRGIRVPSGVSSTSFREAGASSNEYSGLIVGR